MCIRDRVGSFQNPALDGDILHQIVDRWNRLLIRCSSGIYDILRRFFTFILDGIKEQSVVFLENRKNRFSGDRRPASEHDRHLVLLCLLYTSDAADERSSVD